MFERDLVAKGCNAYKHCVIAIIVRIWILNLSCLRSERKSALQLCLLVFVFLVFICRFVPKCFTFIWFLFAFVFYLGNLSVWI